jgi:GT2 family glycosyltransferase
VIADTAAANYPTVSVVVLNYNGLDHLEGCFASLMEIDYPADKVELILVDNASKQNPADFMRGRFPSVKVIVNPQNLGFAEGSNTGARAATGKYVAFLNNDARVHRDWLKTLVASIEASEDIVCAGSRILDWEGKRIDFVGAELTFYGHGFQEAYQSEDIDIYQEEREVLFACGGAMLIDRKIFLDAGGFDSDYFAFFEDVDLGWRLWVLGYRVVLQPQSIVYHKHHGTASKLPPEWKYVMYERNALYTIIKNYDDDNLNKILPAALMLVTKRGLVHSGVVKEGYYLGRKVPVPAILAGDQTAALPGAPAPSDADPSLLARLRKSLKEEGLLETGMKVGRTVVGMATSRLPHRGVDHISKLGMSHFIALDDVILNMPATMEKRRRIQAARKRSDKDVLKLFGAPFKSNCDDNQFNAVLIELSRLYGIDLIFGESDG